MERVKRKSFIISTILVPITMIALMAAPALFMLFSDGESKQVVVVDETGQVFSRLKGNDEIDFVASTAPLSELRDQEDNEVIINIGRDAIAHPNQEITIYTRGSIAMMTDAFISDQLSSAIEDIRLEAYQISNIRQILNEVEVDGSFSTIRIDKEEDTATSSAVSYFIALAMDMMLYMFILIYGQLVMTSIIEEKNNRVLEIVVSSVKPFQLMLGKIVGVGLVAITQILIWAVLVGACSAWVLPLFNASSVEEPELAGMLGQLTDYGFLASLFVYMILFFIGGYLFYSAIYAAIASACDNIQDASQLSTLATMPVIIGIIASMSIINNPGSTLAFWVSIIPFTSPMAMMSRLPFGVPFWEIALSLVLLYISFIFLIWLCGKIYRVGIFMYGKKPSLAEMIRWARYK